MDIVHVKICVYNITLRPYALVYLFHAVVVWQSVALFKKYENPSTSFSVSVSNSRCVGRVKPSAARFLALPYQNTHIHISTNEVLAGGYVTTENYCCKTAITATAVRAAPRSNSYEPSLILGADIPNT